MTSDSQTEPDHRIESIRLVNGQRVLRVVDASTGLCLERAADPAKPVRSQARSLVEALKALRNMPVCTAA
jgi:homoserine acetyltransferase